MDPFVHLHVASGYSLRYGASLPSVLVQRAAEHGQDTLALTDRDGTYGAVKFVKAAASAGVRPILGVDLAISPIGMLTGVHPAFRLGAPVNPVRTDAGPPRRSPARGGASVDPRLPRVTVLASSGSGWAALCRLVSATHLAGERGKPVTTLALLAEYIESAGPGALLLLLGPQSEVGWALAARRPDLADAILRRWLEITAREDLLLEVVSHRGDGDTPRAARMLGFANASRVGAVLTNAVRYADRSDAPTADVLDASRRLVALDPRHVDRRTAEGYLKSGKEMGLVAGEIARAAGCTGSGDGSHLLAATRRVADRCALDPRRDLGMGEIRFPELSVLDYGGRAANVNGGRAANVNGGRVAEVVLRERCEAGLIRRYGGAVAARSESPVRRRLDEELDVIRGLGYPSYFLTVADVVDLIGGMGVRCAARGSGAGSLVNYLLGISGVDPLAHDLLMERFLSPLRAQLPDIDIDVESARRTEIYERILDRYGGERCTCVSMMDTYRVRHAIRDVGAALGMPLGEIDSLAKAFPHIRARDARQALRDLPELRVSGIAESRLDLLFRLVERLDGLPRHIALHPCGVLLSDLTLLDRTPVEASWMGFPMSQFDKDDVEDLGLLKLDVLGVRMQSAMAHAVQEIARVDGVHVDLDDRTCVPLDDPAAFGLIQSTRTLGCFQIESPGQRELVGKFAPETFGDLIIDISLFRPGPVKSDMVTPFLEARQGWREPQYLHPSLEPALRETWGVVVFHEQVLRIVSTVTGCTLAEADEVRRALGSPETQPEVEVWLRPRALGRGYDPPMVDRIWEVLKAFASFGFCKAHAAAFALPTYQSAWLKAHHPAAFLAGVLTHDPGMYPKRLILDDARQFGIDVLGIDVNRSDSVYRVERLAPPESRHGIRLGLADVKGISDAEISRIVAGRPFVSLADFWHRTGTSRPIVERLVEAGGFDSMYGIGAPVPMHGRSHTTRRDLLLHVAELDRWTRATSSGTARGLSSATAARRDSRASASWTRPDGPPVEAGSMDVHRHASRQSQAPRQVRSAAMQLAIDLGDAPDATIPSGLPDMTFGERVRAELDVLGLDVSRHVVDFYRPFLDELHVTRAPQLPTKRSKSELLVAGVKVATQTPPIRSGRRVIFVTLDDAAGPIDATFFEDVQGPFAATVFHSWLLVIRGELRRTGPRGVSLRATGCWELPALFEVWQQEGMAAVAELLRNAMDDTGETALVGSAESRSSRPVMTRPPLASRAQPGAETYEPRDYGGGRGSDSGPADAGRSRAGGMGGRRVLVHPSGFRQSPYADVRPPGADVKSAPRKLWHSSPGSSGA